MKERRKQVNGRSRHRVISCKNHLIVATSISVSRWIKKRIASKELKLLRISFSQTNKNESLLSVDKRKKRKEEKKMRREKWREVKKGKRNAGRALFNSVWRPKLRSTNDTPLDLPRSFELSVESIDSRISAYDTWNSRRSAGFSLFFAAVCSKNVVEWSRIVRQV